MPASLSSLAPETLAFIMTFSDNNTGAFALAFARANKASRSCRYRHLASHRLLYPSQRFIHLRGDPRGTSRLCIPG